MHKLLAENRGTGEMHAVASDADIALRVRYGGTPIDDSGAKKPWGELVVRTHRIERLTDRIFAIATTLLVLGIQVPARPASATFAEFSTYAKCV